MVEPIAIQHARTPRTTQKRKSRSKTTTKDVKRLDAATQHRQKCIDMARDMGLNLQTKSLPRAEILLKIADTDKMHIKKNDHS